MEEQQPYQWMDRRPGALGDLVVIPDEVLCFIIELLDPADVGRLACVSSVMYILCNEEPLWMNLCLKAGLLEYMGSWKKTLLHGQHICLEIEKSCGKPMQFDGFNSLFLYKRWYRRFTTLGTFTLDNGDLERKENLSLNEFLHEFDCQKPVLLTELANAWQARTSWTISELLSQYGDVAFRLSQRSSKKISMKFRDYVSYMELQHDEDPLYIFDDKFGEAAPALLKDYSVPHLFEDDFFDALKNDKRPPFRWLIIGPERSGASWHVDPALTSAWNTLLLGRKRWALYPPGRVPAGVTVHVSEEDGDVNIDGPSSLQWWLDVYPLLANNDKPLECTQLPGETIYVPSGWWHCVLNLETTIAVTQNFVNASNFEFVCLDMAPGHRHKGVCRAGLLAIQDKVDFFEKDTTEHLLSDPALTRKEKRLKAFEPCKEPQPWTNCSVSSNRSTVVNKKFDEQEFSYRIDFLVKFLEERDHYTSLWCASNSIGPREMREWLHSLWALKPDMRDLIWKGACIALNSDKWFTCATEICAFHGLPPPSVDEKLPFGAGSNPVFLLPNFVLKIYAEGGLECAVIALGTELELYSVIRKENSSLISHIPDVVASGIVVNNNGVCQTFPWDGKGVPDVIASGALNLWDPSDGGFSFGVWSKMVLELENDKANSSSNCIWPYLVTKRCRGDMFANLREVLGRDEILHLASCLGEQMKSIHLLPVPRIRFENSVDERLSLIRSKLDCSRGDFKNCVAGGVSDSMSVDYSLSPEWKLIISSLKMRQKSVSKRLSHWGDPIPGFLIDKVEDYLPEDLTLLIKDDDGLYRLCDYPSWIHSDIMDDNILMEPSRIDTSLPGASSLSRGESCPSIGTENSGGKAKWRLTHLLDFSNLSLGDPLCDLIPVHLDIFRGDPCLLDRFLESYKLPLAAKTPKNGIQRVSYRAMCYCILHEDNVLGAIFSVWKKELKSAKSWEEVEEVVWGQLNNYQSSL